MCKSLVFILAGVSSPFVVLSASSPLEIPPLRSLTLRTFIPLALRRMLQGETEWGQFGSLDRAIEGFRQSAEFNTIFAELSLNYEGVIVGDPDVYELLVNTFRTFVEAPCLFESLPAELQPVYDNIFTVSALAVNFRFSVVEREPVEGLEVVGAFAPMGEYDLDNVMVLEGENGRYLVDRSNETSNIYIDTLRNCAVETSARHVRVLPHRQVVVLKEDGYVTLYEPGQPRKVVLPVDEDDDVFNSWDVLRLDEIPGGKGFFVHVLGRYDTSLLLRPRPVASQRQEILKIPFRYFSELLLVFEREEGATTDFRIAPYHVFSAPNYNHYHIPDYMYYSAIFARAIFTQTVKPELEANKRFQRLLKQLGSVQHVTGNVGLVSLGTGSPTSKGTSTALAVVRTTNWS